MSARRKRKLNVDGPLLNARMPYLFNVDLFIEEHLAGLRGTLDLNADETREQFREWVRYLLRSALRQMTHTFTQASERAFSEATRIAQDESYHEKRMEARKKDRERVESWRDEQKQPKPEKIDPDTKRRAMALFLYDRLNEQAPVDGAGCSGRRRFSLEPQALVAATEIRDAGGPKMVPAKCAGCAGWHVEIAEGGAA